MIFYNNANCNIVFWHWEIYLNGQRFCNVVILKRAVLRGKQIAFSIIIYAAHRGGNCFFPRDPLAQKPHPARCHLTDFTSERALPCPYQLLRCNRKSSLIRRELRSLRSTSQHTASVSRNSSCWLLSPALAALTGLRGSAARGQCFSNIFKVS